MTYEECRLKLENIFGESVTMLNSGYDVEYYLGDPIEYSIVVISNCRLYDYYIGFYKYEGLSELERRQLLTMLLELAGTPIDERVNERVKQQKYYLKHKYLEGEGFNYLNCCVLDFDLILSTGSNGERYQTEFTIEEIDKMKIKFDTNFSEFETIEVK